MKPRTLFLLLFASIFLSGCGTFVERVIEPGRLSTKTLSRHDRTGVCLNLDTSVIPPAHRPEAGQILVGYENHFARGADPIPCNTRHNYDHQAAVFFDLTGVAAPGEVVTGAVLEGESRFIALMPVTFTSRDCVNRFQHATATWTIGDFAGPPGDARARIPSEGSGTWYFSSGGPLSRNVEGIVQQWDRGRLPNHGFVFLSPEAHVMAEENSSCVYALSNLRLRVTVFVPERP